MQKGKILSTKQKTSNIILQFKNIIKHDNAVHKKLLVKTVFRLSLQFNFSQQVVKNIVRLIYLRTINVKCRFKMVNGLCFFTKKTFVIFT